MKDRNWPCSSLPLLEKGWQNRTNDTELGSTDVETDISQTNQVVSTPAHHERAGDKLFDALTKAATLVAHFLRQSNVDRRKSKCNQRSKRKPGTVQGQRKSKRPRNEVDYDESMACHDGSEPVSDDGDDYVKFDPGHQLLRR
ncbi:hypothetical protein FVEN_g3672 [Fusarium venenatum]|nr:hypothetical protein FVEN_g3672 [Fusarium venenatum]